MVRGCRLFIEAHGHYLHVLYAVNDMTNTFELFFCLSFLHLRPLLRGHRLLEVTVHALRCLDAVCVAPSVIPHNSDPPKAIFMFLGGRFPQQVLVVASEQLLLRRNLLQLILFHISTL